MDNVQQEVDRLYKSHFGKMVSSLLRFSQDIDLETAEDLVQDSFSAALIAWRQEQLPDNPAGWIFTVCRRKAINHIKASQKLKPLFHEEPIHPASAAAPRTILDDDQLRLLFTCAHPDLSPKVQVVITLKYIANLKVEAIARILGMTIDAVDKLLVRARQKIKEQQLFSGEMLARIETLQTRVPIVHKIIYLLFNEGYKSSWGQELIREELCEEALLLNRSLLNSKLADKDTAALYALMLFNAARIKARFGASGELLDLEEQDRSLWNKDLIQLGTHYLDQSQAAQVSSYHYEAAIAWLHCTAVSYNATNWTAITSLYQQLLAGYPNPFVELNFAIALYYAKRKTEAFHILEKLRQQTFFSQYYLLNAAFGKLYLLEGDRVSAKKYWEQAFHQTSSQLEKDFIQKMIGRSSV